MMSRSFLWISIVTVILLFSACAQDDQVENPPERSEEPSTNEQTENNEDTYTTSIEEPPYIFVDFDLDAEFDGIDDTFEVEYEYEVNEIEASYKDRSQNMTLLGDEALQYLDPIFSSLTFDENTDETEVLDTIIEAFNLPNDAIIDLEIEFKNGEEREYTQM